MAPKDRKRSPTKEEAPDAKKAKAEEKPAEPVKEKYQEPDAAPVKSPLKERIGFATESTSLNVVPTVGGKVLTCLTDGGMSCLLAGARANVGQKSGRYMFETKIIQVTDPHQGQLKAARQTARIGFSTSSSSLMMGEDASSIYFDSEGFCVAAKKNVKLPSSRFGKGQVVALVLNLDSKSPNFNTVALFRDGAAVGDPVPLPEDLKGKELFPHVSYRKLSVQVNFGPDALKELPFKCTLLGAAAASDVSVVASKAPKDGKYEVLMPVAFPDEGTFEWLDTFLEKNPQYTELSDRKIAEWCKASGLGHGHGDGGRGGRDGGKGGKHGSTDKPNFNFGIREVDDMSIRKVLSSITPVVPRNYLIMEVKSNLVAAERKELLKKFNYPCYKKTARVMMGEPNKEYKSVVQTKLLKDKQVKSDNAFKAKKAEAARKKAAAERAKKEAAAKKAAAEAKAKKAAEAKAAAEAKKAEAEAKKAAEGGEEKKEDEEKKEEEKKEEPKAEPVEEKVEETKDEPMEEEDEAAEPPVVELSDEEKKMFHAPKRAHDLSVQVMNSFFSKFSIPDAEEGFDDIQYEWQKKDKASEYLKTWVLNKKLTTRIEDIKPGQTFKDKMAEFKKVETEWKDKLAAFKKGGAKKPAKKSEEEDDVDIFSVADISDIGEGVPLFDQFTYDDWELLKLRFEFGLLLISFKTDCNDPDRAGIPVDHMSFYYNKYYGVHFSPKKYGMDDLKGVLTLIKDVAASKDGLVQSQLTDDLESLDIFIKLTEEHRRERQRRIDAGDETARLKFAPPVEPPKPKPEVPKAAAAPAAAAAVVLASGAAAAAPVVVAAKGKDGKDQKGAGKGKDEQKGGGKDWGKGGGKDWGKEQSKGWGKGKDMGKAWGGKGKW